MVAQAVRQVIEWIYSFSGDYGVAIVLVTVCIRTLLIPLNIQQRKQMKRQQEISGEAERLKEKYKKNPQKMEEELQKLYQEKGFGTAGCLMSFVQAPIMLCLYNGIRLISAAGATTVLLPWVSSLLLRDQKMILPAATLIVQLLPQLYPYIRYFKELELQKMSVPMMLAMLAVNSTFVFVIPSGVGLYYFVSGLFHAAEQLAVNLWDVRRLAEEG
ncbi:MAG: membrane protein insertase YidC [Lachnospiraceae bacterium]|nr:membrane protein insertase YidC [Lachnospiraceae bacterium]